MTEAEILTELVSDMTTYCSGDPDFSASIAEIKAKNAIREFKMRRNLQATKFNDEQIAQDVYNHYSAILEVAMFDYNHTGAEGEVQHNEGGDSRQWASRESLWNGVHAFVKVLS